MLNVICNLFMCIQYSTYIKALIKYGTTGIVPLFTFIFILTSNRKKKKEQRISQNHCSSKVSEWSIYLDV